MAQRGGPTSIKDKKWLIHPEDKDEDVLEKAYGKWLVFRYFSELDNTWDTLKRAFDARKLSAVAIKSSTLYYNPSGAGPGPCIEGAIRIYTMNADIDRVGMQLIEIVHHDIRYKTNQATEDARYTHKGQTHISSHTLFWNRGRPTKEYRRGIKQDYRRPSNCDLWELNVSKVLEPLEFEKPYGKWVITSYEAVTNHWHKLRKEVESGALGATEMVCPAKEQKEDKPVIEVYTTREAMDSVGEKIPGILGEDLPRHYKLLK